MKKILISAFSLYLVFCGSFVLFESDDLFAAEDADQITVTQSVTADISISAPSDVTMSPSLGGVAGGDSHGYAQWTITTGSVGGFTATLTASGTPAQDYVMLGNTQGDWIDNYTSATYNVPDYTWAVTNAAEFGYTATTSTAANVAQAFKSAGAADPCNVAGTAHEDQCWVAASTTARQVMNRSTSAGSGTQLGIHFRVTINNHSVTTDTYVATTTITATTQ